MKKLMKKRTGFTLVELLIVIIIIGILAGAMLLVAGSGTDKANATRIVSEMRSIKAAALMRWADASNWDWVTGETGVNTKVGTYMDRNPDASPVASFDVVSYDNGVHVKATASTIDSGAKTKLDEMLTESGLTLSTDYYMRIK